MHMIAAPASASQAPTSMLESKPWAAGGTFTIETTTRSRAHGPRR